MILDISLFVCICAGWTVALLHNVWSVKHHKRVMQQFDADLAEDTLQQRGEQDDHETRTAR